MGCVDHGRYSPCVLVGCVDHGRYSPCVVVGCVDHGRYYHKRSNLVVRLHAVYEIHIIKTMKYGVITGGLPINHQYVQTTCFQEASG